MLYRFKNPYIYSIFNIRAFIFSGFITIEAPQSLRVIFIIIAVTAFASIFVQKVITRISACADNSLKASALGIIAAVLAAACLNNYNLYFEKQAKNPNCWMDFSTDAFEAGKYLKNLGPEWHAVLAVEGYKIRTFNMALSREDKSAFTLYNG